MKSQDNPILVEMKAMRSEGSDLLYVTEVYTRWILQGEWSPADSLFARRVISKLRALS